MCFRKLSCFVSIISAKVHGSRICLTLELARMGFYSFDHVVDITVVDMLFVVAVQVVSSVIVLNATVITVMLFELLPTMLVVLGRMPECVRAHPVSEIVHEVFHSVQR